MALNPNHTFEDLDDVKCSIAEKNCTPGRAAFLKALLEFNGFTVVVAKAAPPKPKAAPPKPVAEGETPPPPEDPAPDIYTVGVTNLTFSPVNAVFNRELTTPEGHVVSMAYWKQERPSDEGAAWYWSKARS